MADNDPFDINVPEPGMIEPDPVPLPVAVVPPIDGMTPDERLGFLRDLKEAYYTGAHRIRFRERDVTFRKLEEMKKIIDELEAALAPVRRPRPAVFTTFGRGY